jgi:hypothetical protein
MGEAGVVMLRQMDVSAQCCIPDMSYAYQADFVYHSAQRIEVLGPGDVVATVGLDGMGLVLDRARVRIDANAVRCDNPTGSMLKVTLYNDAMLVSRLVKVVAWANDSSDGPVAPSDELTGTDSQGGPLLEKAYSLAEDDASGPLNLPPAPGTARSAPQSAIARRALASLTEAHCALDADDTAAAERAARVAVDVFFLNDAATAEALFAREHNRIPIFALGHGTLAFLRAILSFAPEELEETQVSHHRMPRSRSNPRDPGPVLCPLLSGNVSAPSLCCLATCLPPLSAVFRVQARLRACRELSDKLHPASKLRAAASSAWAAITGGPSEQGRPTARQIDALLVSGEAAFLTSVTHLLSESAVGFLRCGLDIRAGWGFYQQANSAVGGAAMRLGADAEVTGSIPCAVGVGKSGGVFRGQAGSAEASSSAAGAASSSAAGAASSSAAGAAGSGDFDCMRALGLTPDRLAKMDAVAEAIASDTARLVAGGTGPGHGGSAGAGGGSADVLGRCLAQAVRTAIEAAAGPSGDGAPVLHSAEAASSVEPVLGGVLFGCGSFNVIGSVLPPSIAKLIQLLGFPANR